MHHPHRKKASRNPAPRRHPAVLLCLTTAVIAAIGLSGLVLVRHLGVADRAYARITNPITGTKATVTAATETTITAAATAGRAPKPTAVPTTVPAAPTAAPTIAPTVTPTVTPTAAPAAAPTAAPTAIPTVRPTAAPTAKPTPKPTAKPTTAPTPTPAYTTDANGVVWYNGFADPRSIKPRTVANPDALDVLVNKYWQLPNGYVPPLVSVPHSASQRLHPAAAEAWNALYDACLAETGVSLFLVSGYRSQGTQEALFNRALQEKGVAHTVAYYAHPGRSEHQLGLGLDIGTDEKKYISQYFLTTPGGRWMLANGHRFGFILRYPSGRSSLTGYGFEAWHFRYVGVAKATAVKQQGTVLDQA